MQEADPVAIVQAWQNAAIRQDIDALLTLSDPNIEIVGPRGSGYGHQLLRDWLGRAGLRLETLQVFGRDGDVVVAQHGVWRSVATGEVIGEQDIASRFRVVDGQIVLYARYDHLDEALAAAGLTHDDEVAGR